MKEPASNVRSLREVELLLDISQLLETSLDLREILNPVLDLLTERMHMQRAFLTLRDRQTEEMFLEASSGLNTEEKNRGRYKIGEGVTGQVVETGKPHIIAKTSESEIYLNRIGKTAPEEHSFVCVPIRVGSEIAGTLAVDRIFDPKENLDEDARLLQIISSLLGQAVRLRRQAREEKNRLEQENERLKAELQHRFQPNNIVGRSHEMQEVYDQIAQVSQSNASVLVQGDTGTGKELVAQAIHYNSPRRDKPFVKTHCAALPENLIESELFGHTKGAFTGATTDRKGRFELAHGGTIFLDEIGEIPLSIQIKLLRVLQEKEIERVGDPRTISVNVRVIAATNRDLAHMVAEGTFREDLYYRLNVFPITVPPLTKRKSDILLLADYFLEQYAEENNKSIRRLSSAAIDMLYTYHWPGNVRELENAIERAVVLAESDTIYPHHLPPTLQTAEAIGSHPRGNLKSMVEAYERGVIQDALKSSRGNIAAAARTLQTTQRILGYKVKNYGIEPKKYTS